MDDAIGLCTWIYGHQNHRLIASEAAALGCAGVELFVDLQCQSAAELRSLYADQGLRILSLTPENVDLCHADPAQRQSALDTYIRLLDYAVDVKSAAVTIHEFVGRGKPHDNPQAEWQRLVAATRQLASEAEQRGLDLLFEPLRKPLVSHVHTAASAVALTRQVGSARLRLVLDTFHMEASETDPATAIAASAGLLGAVQLADRGRRALGAGGMDVAKYLNAFQAIGFSGPWILECTTGLVAPSLEPRAVDPAVLRDQLSASIALLQRMLGPQV